MNISEKDLEFLKAMSHEIKTQDNCWTNPPILYRIKNKEFKPLWHDCDAEFAQVMYDCEEFGLYENSDKGFRFFLRDYIRESKNIGYKRKRVCDWDDIKTDLYEDNFYVVFGSYQEVYENYFFTKKHVDKHLELMKNKYHKNACVYATHLTRNKEFERLIEIIKNMF